MQYLLPFLALVAAVTADAYYGGLYAFPRGYYGRHQDYAHDAARDASHYGSHYDQDGALSHAAFYGQVSGGHKEIHQERHTATKHNIDKERLEVHHKEDTRKAAHYQNQHAAAVGADHQAGGHKSYHDAGASGKSVEHVAQAGHYGNEYGSHGHGAGHTDQHYDAHSADAATKFAQHGNEEYAKKDQAFKHDSHIANAGLTQAAGVEHHEVYAKDNEDYQHRDAKHESSKAREFHQVQNAYADQGQARYGYNRYADRANAYSSQRGHQADVSAGNGYGYGAAAYGDYARAQAAGVHQAGSGQAGRYSIHYADADSHHGADQKSHDDEKNSYVEINKKSRNAIHEVRHKDYKNQDAYANQYGQAGNQYNKQDYYAAAQAGSKDSYANQNDRRYDEYSQQAHPHYSGY